MREWKKGKLAKIIQLVMGQSPSGDACNNDKIGAPLLNGPTEFGDHHPFPIQFTTDPKKFAEIGDILFCVRGSTTGRMNWADQKYVIGRGIAAIRHKKGLTYQYFLKALIDYKLPQMLKTTTGSTFPNISKDQFLNLEILLPSSEDQKNISSIFSSIDNKIDLLRRQNEKLEAIAQTLFKRWFVEFEFPNKEGQPYKSSGGKMVSSELGEIPEGWRVGKLGEHVIIINGYSYKSSELVKSSKALVTLKNFDRNGGFKLDGFKEFQGNYKKQQIVEEGGLVVAHTDLTQKAEVLGNPALIISPMKYEKLIISMDLVKVKPKGDYISKAFLYFLMRERKFKYHCKGYANGTTVLHLSKNAIPEYLCCLPTDNFKIIRELSNILENIVNKISLNTNQICIFTQTRDALLPKLMSGQIRVK